MDTTTTASPTWAATDTSTGSALRAAAVEQVMRACDDDLAVLPFLDVEPRSAAAAAALGRLLSTHPQRLLAGCPLIGLVTGGAVDPHWRGVHPPRAESLYAHLEFLVAMYGPVDASAYDALELLRARSEQDLPDLF